MKKVLLSAIIALAPMVSFAQTKIYGVWGFTPGSTQGSYVREILEESNRIQKKYEFVFEHKPGAGSYIAAKSVLDRNNALLANSAAQFVRPYLYSDSSWKFDEFKPVMMMGMNPAALVTGGKSLDELVKQSKITLATSGPGSSTHLMAEVFAKEIKSKFPGKDIVMAHFKDTNEAFVSVSGGHTDATFEFLGDAKAKATSKIRFIGLTGPKSIDSIATLSSLGYPNLGGVQGIFAWYAPKGMPKEQVLEFQKIFLQAEKSAAVQRLYKSDYASRDNAVHNEDNLNKWYDSTVKKFADYTQGISVK